MSHFGPDSVSPNQLQKNLGMCFSATASFVAGVSLTGVGVVAFRSVEDSRQYPLASVPLIFAVQQLIEGVVWLSLTHPAYEHFRWAASYAYLIFAQGVWPVWVPFSIMLLEDDRQRKRMLSFLTVLGCFLATFLIYYVFLRQATAEIRGHHIHYGLDTPAIFRVFPGTVYIMVTVVSPFVSSVKRMSLLGWSSLSSLLLSVFYFEQALISVWCFFAAIISLVVIFVLHQYKGGPVKVVTS